MVVSALSLSTGKAQACSVHASSAGSQHAQERLRLRTAVRLQPPQLPREHPGALPQPPQTNLLKPRFKTGGAFPPLRQRGLTSARGPTAGAHRPLSSGASLPSWNVPRPCRAAWLTPAAWPPRGGRQPLESCHYAGIPNLTHTKSNSRRHRSHCALHT